MKGRLWAAALVLLLAVRSAGILPRGREMEELSLITALAADGTGERIALTAVTGVRAGEDKEPEVLTGEGADMAAACQAVQEARASHAYLGQADKLLLGEGLARTRLMEVLEFVLDHRELRLDTLLYIVRGDAGQGLAATAPTVAGETPGEDTRGVTVGQVLARLCEGRTVRVPVLAADGEGLLAPAGWAVLGETGLVSWAGDGQMAEAGEGERAYG